MHDKALSQEVKVKVLNILAMAALKDDVILLLHQDRKDHVIMNYAFDIDRHSIEEQQGLALLVSNRQFKSSTYISIVLLIELFIIFITFASIPNDILLHLH